MIGLLTSSNSIRSWRAITKPVNHTHHIPTTSLPSQLTPALYKSADIQYIYVCNSFIVLNSYPCSCGVPLEILPPSSIFQTISNMDLCFNTALVTELFQQRTRLLRSGRVQYNVSGSPLVDCFQGCSVPGFSANLFHIWQPQGPLRTEDLTHRPKQIKRSDPERTVQRKTYWL